MLSMLCSNLGGRRPWIPRSCLSWMVIAIPLASLTSTISLSPLVSAEAASVPGVSDVVHPACLGGPGGGGRRHGSWGWLSRIRSQDGCNYSWGWDQDCCCDVTGVSQLWVCIRVCVPPFSPHPHWRLVRVETFCGVLYYTGQWPPQLCINITTSRDGDTAGHGLHNTFIPPFIRLKSETISMRMSSSSS